MIENKKLWDNTLAQIELNVSKANFGTWFRNTCITKQEEGTIYLGVPNTFVRDWLINKYHKLILKSLRELDSNIRALEYTIIKIGEVSKIRETENKTTNNDLGLNELYINKESNLNPKYTFSTFIVGSFNEVAYAASQAVINNLGSNYNPLFIYGGTGLGKTHLIQSVGNFIRTTYPNKSVYYLSSEIYSNDFVRHVQNNNSGQFKEKYKKYDLLIMDDVQFLSNKEKTQEELFHLFNYLYENGKQIVFSSDKPPKFIPNLEERLRSRFEGGMIVDVSKPDYESRLAILKTKITNLNVKISDEIIDYLSNSIQDNIRELEGALNTIICQIQVKKNQLNLTEVKNLLKNNLKQQRTLSAKDVMKTVADYYNIEEKILYEKTRRKEVVKPRQIIMYLLREDFNTSYPHIGQKLGGKDHTTVMHAYEKIKESIKNDEIINQEINQIRSILYNQF